MPTTTRSFSPQLYCRVLTNLHKFSVYATCIFFPSPPIYIPFYHIHTNTEKHLFLPIPLFPLTSFFIFILSRPFCLVRETPCKRHPTNKSSPSYDHSGRFSFIFIIHLYIFFSRPNLHT